jgi:hypothetical protein
MRRRRSLLMEERMLRDYSPLASAFVQADIGYAQPSQAVPV